MDTYTRFSVVLNDHNQYSLWPVDKDMPLGWHREGFDGGREDCLDYIGAVWTDMTPTITPTH
ncbi:MbtH family protein [Nocardia amamiensis]|uniref:MbtH family protein n=1 Tax=Nocardia amamiensis TaxID=404578 RepID=UPI000832D7FA|nr:MbtH family NRPS accessory protein [Nocardia amamiensis]